MSDISKSILIVDDDPYFRSLVCEILKTRGFEVAEAASGSEANGIISRSNPLMAIIDYRMPEVDGLTWIKTLRESGRNLLLVFVSAVWCDAKTFNWLRNILKVSLILQKPIQPELFIQQIESLLPAPLLEKLLRERNLKTKNNSIASDANASTPIESEKLSASPVIRKSQETLLKRTSKDSALNRQNKLTEIKTNYASQLSKSWEELSIATNTARKESLDIYLLNEAKQIAHKLAGTAGSLGFIKTGEAAGRIYNLLTSIDPEDYLQGIIWTEIERILEQGTIFIRESVSASNALTQGNEALAINRILVYGNKNEYSYASDNKLNITPLLHIEVEESPINIMQLVKRTDYNAIIFDIDMGSKEDIFALAGNIRLVPGYQGIPLGFVSPEVNRPKTSELLFAGSSVLIMKPFKKTDIEEACKRLLDVAQMRKTRVLIVDDDQVLTRFIAGVLGEEGLTVSILNNPIDIINAVESFQPDLVLLDAVMPGLSGYDICRMLRNDERWRKLTIVFLTSRNDQEGRAAAYKAGANDFLSKPVITRELTTRIKGQLGVNEQKSSGSSWDRIRGPMNSIDFMLAANTQLLKIKETNIPMNICLLSIDDFANFSILHGLSSAQEIVAALEKLIYVRFRAEDLRGKLTEDTFMLSFLGETQETITEAINNLLSEFTALKFTSHNLNTFKVSFSAGISEYPSDAQQIQNLLNVAHNKLLKAKQSHPGAIAGREMSKRSY